MVWFDERYFLGNDSADRKRRCRFEKTIGRNGTICNVYSLTRRVRSNSELCNYRDGRNLYPFRQVDGTHQTTSSARLRLRR